MTCRAKVIPLDPRIRKLFGRTVEITEIDIPPIPNSPGIPDGSRPIYAGADAKPSDS